MTMNAADPVSSPAPRRGWLVVISLILSLAGLPLYLVLIDQPFLRATGLPAFALMLLGAGLALFAVVRDRRRWVRGAAALHGALIAGGIFAFFVFAALPEPAGAESLPVAPDFTLPDHAERAVSLGETLRGGPVLLAFYRGWW